MGFWSSVSLIGTFPPPVPKLLIQMLSRMRPRTDILGTPHETFCEDNFDPFILIFCMLLLSLVGIHLTIILSTCISPVCLLECHVGPCPKLYSHS